MRSTSTTAPDVFTVKSMDWLEIMNKDELKLSEIKELKTEIAGLKTIGEWKSCVKRFATKYGLTDREAIDVANSPDW